MPLLPVSHQKQRQQADCLVACAAMVLRYWQVSFKPDRLPYLLRTEKHGTVFSHLHALSTLGVTVLVEGGSMAKLGRHLENGCPCIVAVETGELRSYRTESTSHAVVVVGVEQGVIYLNDPAFDHAPQMVSVGEFELAWLEQDYRYGLIQR